MMRRISRTPAFPGRGFEGAGINCCMGRHAHGPASFAACALIWTGSALAQGRGGADWTTANADAQRTSWVRADARITKESVQSPDFKLAWKLKLDNAPRQLNSLSQPVHMGITYGLFTLTPLVFVAGSSDNVYGIDGDMGRVLWKKNFSPAGTPQPAGSLACPGGMTAGLTRPTVLAPAPAAAAGAGRGGRGGRAGAAGGAVGEPFAGAPNLAAADSARGGGGGGAAAGVSGGRGGPGAASGGRAGGGGGGGGGANSLYAISSDGFLHSLNVQNGADTAPPVPFLPANASPSGLILINNVVYAAGGPDCGGAPNSLWAMDLNTPGKTVSSWRSASGGVAGAAGPAFGSDGTIYVATGGSGYGSLVALEPGTLKAKQWYAPARTAFDSTPVVILYKGKDLVVVSGSDGRLHLLDGSSPGGADHQTPLYATPVLTSRWAGGALAGYEDANGGRWVLASAGGPVNGLPAANGAVTNGAVIALKLTDQNGKLSLEPEWASHDMMSPLPPMVIGSVIFALSSGEYRSADASVSVAQRVQRSTPAVLYALDTATGKELWSSGGKITSFAHSGGLSAGAASVYVSTYDSTLYAFGFPLER